MNDPAFELTREDFEKIEADLLADGLPVRGLGGRLVSRRSRTSTSRFAGPADSGEHDYDEEGRPIVGTGDNVFPRPAT